MDIIDIQSIARACNSCVNNALPLLDKPDQARAGVRALCDEMQPLAHSCDNTINVRVWREMCGCDWTEEA
jgi:hypothetical protein